MTDDNHKIARIVRIVEDLAQKPVDKLTIMDLGCLHGEYSRTFAAMGAEVHAIEGRAENIAAGAEQNRQFPMLKVFEDDVRNLLDYSRQYDIILCLGLLYHMNHTSAVKLVHDMYAKCKSFVIIDTHVSLKQKNEWFSYHGRLFKERAKDPWSALGNETSFWFTLPSLLNLLADAGFTSVYQCHNPSEPDKPSDRVTLVAMKGAKPLRKMLPHRESKNKPYITQRWHYEVFDTFPELLKNMIRKVVG